MAIGAFTAMLFFIYKGQSLRLSHRKERNERNIETEQQQWINNEQETNINTYKNTHNTHSERKKQQQTSTLTQFNVDILYNRKTFFILKILLLLSFENIFKANKNNNNNAIAFAAFYSVFSTLLFASLILSFLRSVHSFIIIMDQHRKNPSQFVLEFTVWMTIWVFAYGDLFIPIAVGLAQRTINRPQAKRFIKNGRIKIHT